MDREINDAVFDFIYGEALNDLYWRGGVNQGLKGEVEKNSEIKDIVRKYVTYVVNGYKYNTYGVIENVSEIEIKDKCTLTFGNAQKLVNLVMKYLYIQYYDICRENFRWCHATMDDTMRDLVWEQAKKAGIEAEANFNNVAWSNVSEDQYRAFQNSIIKLMKECKSYYCIPIEFEYLNWNKAKGKKKNEMGDLTLEYDFFKETK